MRRIAVASLILALAACTGKPAVEAPAPVFGGGWARLPAAPLAARYDAHAFALGSTLVVLGGTTAPPCPPNADCIGPNIPPMRDGAALDTTTKKWKPIAPAPVPLGSGSGVVSGKRIFLWIAGIETLPAARQAFLTYDLDADRWTELPRPPIQRGEHIGLVAAGEKVVGYFGSQERGARPDLVFDRKTGWRPLPADPLVPSFDRTVVWTDKTLVLVAPQSVPQPNGARPSVYRAAELDLATSRWRRFADSEVVAYDPSWFSVAGLVVNASAGSSDGGGSNGWGRAFPHGGILDPATNTWRNLPPWPGIGSFRGRAVAGGRHVTTAGLVYDAQLARWARLSMPSTETEGLASTWVGDTFAVWGGYAWGDVKARMTADGWVWTPDPVQR